jgi:hypothetical protein
VFTASGQIDELQIDKQTDHAVVIVPALDGVVLRVSAQE